MANKKISQFNVDTNPTSVDILPIVNNGETKKYLPGEIYGYSDGENKFRFFFDDKNEGSPYGYFKMEENKELIIYSQWNLHGGTFYFYSKDCNSPIKDLLKKKF